MTLYDVLDWDRKGWPPRKKTRAAQAIEARRAETGTGSVHESAVATPCAQTSGKDA